MIEKGVKPNAHLYSAMINACARRIEIESLPRRTRLVLLERAFNLYQEMLESTMHIDAPVYNALLTACGAAKQLKRAMSLYHDMRSAKLKMTERTYFTLMSIAKSCGDGDQALEFYKKFRKSGLQGRAQLYSCAILSCGHLKAGSNADIACNIWKEMEVDGVTPDHMLFANLISIAVSAWGPVRAENLIVKCRDSLGRLPAKEMINSLRAGYNTLLGGYARKGRAEEMLVLYERMTNSGIQPDSDSYETLIVGCSKANDYRQIVALFQEQREAGLPITSLMYTWAISAAVRAGEANSAFDLAHSAWSEGIPRSSIITFWLLRACVARVMLIYQVGSSNSYGTVQSYQQTSFIQSSGSPFKSGHATSEAENPIEFWTNRAITAYRDAMDHGVEVNVQILDRLLHCMRRPMSHITKSTTVDRDPYDNRAIIIYEDAVQRGIVAPPQFQTEICDLVLTKTMPAVGEVALLYVLRHLRRHPYKESFDIHIHTQPVGDLEMEKQNDERSDTDLLKAEKLPTLEKNATKGSLHGRYQQKNLYKSKLAAHAVLSILRRLNITYEHNRKTGLVRKKKSHL